MVVPRVRDRSPQQILVPGHGLEHRLLLAQQRVDPQRQLPVVGVDDDKFGQAVTAVASLAPGVSVDEATVIASVKADIASFKGPKRVVFVASVPRAPNGKADYKSARQLATTALT